MPGGAVRDHSSGSTASASGSTPSTTTSPTDHRPPTGPSAVTTPMPRRHPTSTGRVATRRRGPCPGDAAAADDERPSARARVPAEEPGRGRRAHPGRRAVERHERLVAEERRDLPWRAGSRGRRVRRPAAAGLLLRRATCRRRRPRPVVRDEHGRGAGGDEGVPQVDREALAQGAVEGGSGSSSSSRGAGQGPGERDALAPAAGEGRDRPALVAGQSHQLEQRETDDPRGIPYATFPATDRCANSCPSWNISPNPRRCTGTPSSGTPSHATVPAASGSRPATARKSDDFPHPDGPSSATRTRAPRRADAVDGGEHLRPGSGR
jgi:hypothetical protein